MTTRRFVLVAVIGLIGGALCLALAAVLDKPELAMIGTTLVLGVVLARTAWTWLGAGRQWLLWTAGLAGVILVAFLFEKLFA
jgi:uncharacterized membrane protein